MSSSSSIIVVYEKIARRENKANPLTHAYLSTGVPLSNTRSYVSDWLDGVKRSHGQTSSNGTTASSETIRSDSSASEDSSEKGSLSDFIDADSHVMLWEEDKSYVPPPASGHSSIGLSSSASMHDLAPLYVDVSDTSSVQFSSASHLSEMAPAGRLILKAARFDARKPLLNRRLVLCTVCGRDANISTCAHFSFTSVREKEVEKIGVGHYRFVSPRRDNKRASLSPGKAPPTKKMRTE